MSTDIRPSCLESACEWRLEKGVSLLLHSLCLVRCEMGGAFATIARGAPDIAMAKGNFSIEDSPFDVIHLTHAEVDGPALLLSATPGGPTELRITIESHAQADAVLSIETIRPGYDRIWLSLNGEPDEHFWGGGEQMSYLQLNGRRFPMWTSEPGVGRDKSDPFTQAMDAAGMAGGDYWTTNYPQPTYLSSRGYALHADIESYSVLDFTQAGPSLEIWQPEARIELYRSANLPELVGRLSARFGRQPALPDWAIGGAIIGLKEGARSFDRLDRMRAAGVAVAALWCEDWAGIRETSFGRRLRWNWQWSSARYPDLPARIAGLKDQGIRFLAYANPYLSVDGPLFQEAASSHHLVLRQDDDRPYLVDFGEFEAGIVDFTRADSRDWFAERVLGREMLDLGIDGWMADFGEYLPVDVRLADGSDPMRAHNRWPVLWAAVNAQSVRSRGRAGDALFFMRAGYSGVQAYCPLLWAGDQSVDFSRHDGIGTVVTAALSAGLVGNAYSHGDCGGYTSLAGKVRSTELMLRWFELAAFAPIMRTHEGNRPDDNLQVDSSPELLSAFAGWTRVHAALAPYVRHLSDEAVTTGLPVQRPLFLHFEGDPQTASIQDQFLYGRDMLVAPIIEDGARSRSVYLPAGSWTHVWSGRVFDQGWHEIAAPVGEPPVFYRADCKFTATFSELPSALEGRA